MSDLSPSLQLMVTGANGFIGQRLCVEALARRFAVRGSMRQVKGSTVPRLQSVVVNSSDDQTAWAEALSGCRWVVHLAARVHIMHEAGASPLADFRRVNVAGTLNLARQAAAAGVHRFVFVSSIGVNGDRTSLGEPFTERHAPLPHNDYALSKCEAEQGLRLLAAETGMEVVIIRPPLVYGPQAPGNFGSLMRAVKRGLPLPLGAVHNQRSLVALDNLVDFIITCVTHPQAANQTFLVSDGQDLSTTDLVRGMARAAGVHARLIPVPVPLLRAVASVLGKAGAVDRLCGTLQVDVSKARNLLGWQSPVSVEEGLQRAMSAER